MLNLLTILALIIRSSSTPELYTQKLEISNMATTDKITLQLHFKEESKKEVINISSDFKETKKKILDVFGIEENDISNYSLKFPSGGLIEQNEVIFDNDRLWIIPNEMAEEPTGYTPLDEVDTKLKEEQMKDLSLDPKDKESYKSFHISKITKSDYDSLEWLLLTKQYTEHHALTEIINKKWSLPLGFSMKLLRPPKTNKDGTQTLRLYWNRFNRNVKKENGKENITKNPEANDEDENWKFGITFKQDNETRIWLLYQEFDQANFVHNHKCMERPNNLELNIREHDVEEYRKNHKDRVRSLATLQRLINQKNDFSGQQRTVAETDMRKERFLKVKQELPRSRDSKFLEKQKKNALKIERKDGVKPVKDISYHKETEEFVEFLKKQDDKVSGYLKFDSSLQENGKKKITKVFYSNESMKETYYQFRDFVYIHRRITETRFKKLLTLIIGVDNYGFNRVFSIALTTKDDIPSWEWIFNHFNEYMGKAKPKTIIMERNKNVHKSLISIFNGQETSIVYWPYYIHKSLRFEFENDLKSNNELLFEKIISTPLIESQTQFEHQLWEVKNYAMMTNNDRHRNLILKLESEKILWATWYQKHLFLGGAVIWDRIAKIKGFLKVWLARWSNTPISDVLKNILEIDKADLKGYLESRSISAKHNQIFMNFKIIQDLWNSNKISGFVKEKIKWYASKSFKYEIIEKDENQNVFVVQKKRELGGSDKAKSFSDDAKVALVGNYLFWTCLSQFTTGIPWAHEFSVHMKYPDYNLRLNKRWFSGYTEAGFSVDQINSYLKLQQKLRSNVISYMKDLKLSNIKITDADFSFKTVNLWSSNAEDIIQLIKDDDNLLVIPFKETEHLEKSLNQEQLMRLVKQIDINSISLDDFDKLINAEDEST